MQVTLAFEYNFWLTPHFLFLIVMVILVNRFLLLTKNVLTAKYRKKMYMVQNGQNSLFYSSFISFGFVLFSLLIC